MKKTSGYYRDEFGRLARFYDLGLKLVFRMVGGEERFRRSIIDAASLKPGQSVLDVNCGTGTLALMMAPVVGGAGRVTGTDLAGRMLEVARHKNGNGSVDFIRANAEDLPFGDSSFDRVTSSLAIHEMNREGRANAIAEIWRVLRPAGLFVVADLRQPDTWFTRLGMGFVKLAETDTLDDMWERDLGNEVRRGGFEIESREAAGKGFFEVFAAVKSAAA